MNGSSSEALDFMEWFCDLSYAHKIFVTGNHDEGVFLENVLEYTLIDGLDVNCNGIKAKTVPRGSTAKNPCCRSCLGLAFVLKTEAQPLVRQIIRLDYFAVHGGAIS